MPGNTAAGSSDSASRMVIESTARTALGALAACAEGVSRLSGAGELRVKESDRVATIAAGLRALAFDVHEAPDGLAVTGGVPRGGARITTQHDHRIAMAFAVLALRADEPVWFDDLASVPTSYPSFFDTLAGLGGSLEPEEVA